MVSKHPHHDLFLKALRDPSLARFLQEYDVAKSGEEFLLTHVTQAAWSFLCSTIIATLKKAKPVWILCSDIKKEEYCFQELQSWLPGTLFFPDIEMSAEGLGLPDPELLSERLDILGRYAQGEVLTTVITARTLTQNVPSPKELISALWQIDLGFKASPNEVVERLYKLGFARTSQVASRGELALRGGILDLFPWQSNLPYRLEFDETAVISMRTFDPHSQRSIQEKKVCEIQSADLEKGTIPFAQLISTEDLVVILGDDFPHDEESFKKIAATKIRIIEGMDLSQSIESQFQKRYDVACYPIPFASFGAGDFVMQESKRKEFFAQVHAWCHSKNDVILFSSTEGEEERFSELLQKSPLDASSVALRQGELKEGFSFPKASLVFLSDAEIFGRSARSSWQRFHRRQEEHRSVRSALNFTEFLEGDFVVHTDYGIGRYQGIQLLPSSDGTATEVLALEFDEEARLFVPLEHAWKVSRYVGVGKAIPTLSSLNNGQWHKARAAAEKSIFLYAGKLLKLQAEREIHSGHTFSPDTPWQRELEKSFPYKETQDQLRAITEIKQDMESPQPMDRLLCGDVGFGKTEVALRAAFKALMDGKQVVFLAPTTVLAQQHYETLRERMSPFPVSIELMSRYRTAAEQRQVTHGLAAGSIDLVVGTHRLFSPDIIFKNLGLVIVDEEQRFGVKHKEAFKDRFRLVDMLTLSATPIPRTLYLSLMGARKMSLLETPPANRQSVETLIAAYDERLIRDAAKRELDRGGQVYFLHNRVQTIEKVALRLQELIPSARIAWGHGQMEEKALEEIMHRFVVGEIDILVSTTIIESGLDIPNANTIIIDRADRFGLADLYQLRGRVGRSQHKAYAYLLLPRSMMLEGEARRRVQAIRHYSELGAGFKIAMRDLEIRGAGNLLGTAQSGHITAVGFDFYCKMLHQAVATLQGKKSEMAPQVSEVSLLFDFVAFSSSAWAISQEEKRKKEKVNHQKFVDQLLPAFIPEDYLSEASMRIDAYRHLAAAPNRLALEELKKSWSDRFGSLPLPAKNLLLLEVIRRVAAEHRLTKLETRGPKLMMTRGGDYILLGHQFPRLTSIKPEAKLKEILGFLEGLH
ncbi:MAG: transcription-repair coupling factor [Verrucomicrobia bacterium]|nr:MAG: transcription-repair coupling factor [Verrucomicrobiota bacterium]